MVQVRSAEYLFRSFILLCKAKGTKRTESERAEIVRNVLVQP